MTETEPHLVDLHRELADLRQRLEVSEAIVRAIGRSEVDAFLVRPDEAADEEVLVLGSVDRPYQLLIERMQQGAATVGCDGTVLYSNRYLADLVRCSRPGLSGCKLTDFVCERDRQATAELLERGCREAAELEVTLATEAGDEVPVQLTAGPLLDHSGLTCLVVTDLRHQRAQELQRERLTQEEAARAAAEHTAGILREADQRKDVFLATLAHELRNPLAPLRSGLHVLQLMRPDDEDFKRTHAILARQLETLVRLVDDLLDVGRLTQGKISLQRSRFDARQVVTRALETCQALVTDRGHRVQTSVPDQPVLLEADEVRVTQVLTNLLNNAAKYTPKGGTISLSLELSPDGTEAVFRVRDTGVGIPAELLGSIFEPFTQVQAGSRASAGGLGIGLTLARSLVQMHGGTISVGSDGPGRGSEFVVRLPAAETRRTSVPAEGPAAKTGRARARVLVVDDNRDAAESLGLLLSRLGHVVRLENHAAGVVAAVRSFAPDLVLLDIGLPDIDGYEVTRRLRADPRCQDVYIVGLTGFASPQDRARALGARFDEHCAKPIDLAELGKLIDRATAASQARQRPTGEATSEQGS